ncbi:DUF6783 domain-containing protein [Oliverpabstia intestinalis]|uniref:DUF6783 domain-containing protein n=1 Tax=Oliverpabstia intestinalis TaxID=2606633 RepID=UPI002FE6E4B1
MFFSDVLLPELPFIFLSFLYCVFQNPLFPVSLSKSVGSVPICRLIIAIHSSGCLNLCLQKYRKPYIRVRFPVAFSFYRARACLKKAFRELRVLVCGRFYPNEGVVAGYGNRMRVKYTAKWGLQITEMIFQTRSWTFLLHFLHTLLFVLILL